MPLTRPEVETVMRRGGMARPLGSVRMPKAAIRWSRLCRGSPMPMNTRFTGTPSGCPWWFSMATTWPTISAAVRLRTMPICPVAQKVQPMAQPTWLERQRVTRSSDSSVPSKPRAGSAWPWRGGSGGVGRRPDPRTTYGMWTPSTCFPSASSKACLVDPSSEARLCTMAGQARSTSASRWVRRAFGRLENCSQRVQRCR